MAEPKYFESDFQLITHSFLSGANASVLFDPNGKVLRNIQSDLFRLNSVDELQTVSQKAENLNLVITGDAIPEELNLNGFTNIVSTKRLKLDLSAQRFFIFKGKYDNIRFLFPRELKKPFFYQVTHEHYDYPWWSRAIDQAGMTLGLHPVLADGSFYIYHQHPLKPLFDPANYPEGYFLFSEDYPFMRIASVFSIESGKIIRQHRFADTSEAAALLTKEADILNKLHRMEDTRKFEIPSVVGINGSLELTNNWPAGAETDDLISDIHLSTLGNLYSVNRDVNQVGIWLEEGAYLNTIRAISRILAENLQPRGLSKSHIEDICIDLISLINRFNPKEPLFTSIYHGAFIPSNLPIQKGRLYLNNWEHSREGIPLLFDVFYFMFRRMEYRDAPMMGELDDMMKHLFRNKELMKLIEEYQIDFKLNLALFHIFHIVNRLENFLKQRYINPNVNFVLSFWKQALERMNQVDL